MPKPYPSVTHPDSFVLIGKDDARKPALKENTELALIGLIPDLIRIKVRRLFIKHLQDKNQVLQDRVERLWPKHRNGGPSTLLGFEIPGLIRVRRTPMTKQVPPSFSASLEHLGEEAFGVLTSATVELSDISPTAFYNLVTEKFGPKVADRMVPGWNEEATKAAVDAGRIKDPSDLFKERQLSHHQLNIDLYGPTGEAVQTYGELPEGMGEVDSSDNKLMTFMSGLLHHNGN
jgi:hypothetical protein